MAPPYPARTMARSTRKSPPGSSFELYARAMLDRWLGKSATVRRLPRGLGTFHSVLMLGNNLGLAGDLPRFRRFLRELRGITRNGGHLIGHSRIPGTWSEDHLPYVKWNVRRGRPAGLLTLRVRYKGRVGDWFDLLLIPPDELAKAAHETGWDLGRVIWEGGSQPGDYVGVLEKR